MSPVHELIEFHDSDLTDCVRTGANIELRINAYVHRWEQLDGCWRGTGWVQDLSIVVSDAHVDETMPRLPVSISDGRLRVGDNEHEIVPTQFESGGPAALVLRFDSNHQVEVVGSTVQIHPIGPARYVEDLPPDFAPRDDL